MSTREELLRLCQTLTPEEIARLDEKTQRALLSFTECERQRRREFPIAFYTPHDKQRVFHASDKRIRIILGANRSGKTQAGTAELIAAALGYRPWQVPGIELIRESGTVRLPRRDEVPSDAWFRRPDGEPVRVPNRILVVTGLSIKRGIGEGIWAKWLDLWPREVKPRVWMGQGGSPEKLRLPNGTTIIFASAEQGAMQFESLDYDAAWFDEPVPLFVYNGVWRGLTDHYGPLWLTQTPLGTNAKWVYLDLLNGDIARPRPDVFVQMVNIRDNYENLDEKAIKDFEDNGSWTEQERAARLEGKPEFLADTVWTLFRKDVHVIDKFEPDPSWTRGVTIDPHQRRPWFIAWWCYTPNNEIIFYREWPNADFHRMRSSDRAIADYVSLIREIEGKERVTWRLLDPNFGRSPVQSSIGQRGVKTLQDELAEYGLEFCTQINDSLDYGIEMVQNSLRWDKNREVGPENRPKLFFAANCKNLITAVENFARMPITKETKLHENQFSEEFKDGADVVRYTIVAPKVLPSDGYNYLQEEALDEWDV